MSAFRWFGKLEDELTAVGEWLSALQTLLIYAGLMALYEATKGKAPSGAGAQVVYGHDHRGSSGWGGRPVSRGNVASGGIGQQGMWRVTTVASTWKKVDADYTAAQGNRSSVTWMIEGFVSPGMTSSGNPPVAAPYLSGELHYQFYHATATVQARWRHSSGAYSPAFTLTAHASQVQMTLLDFIPCTGDSWNDWDLEVWSDTAGIDVDIYRYHLCENHTDIPASAGTIQGAPGWS